MKFVANRNVENRVFSVELKFTGYGNEDKGVSAESEVEMLKDYGYPKIEVGGTFGTEDKSFILPSKQLELKEGFIVMFSASIDKMQGETEEEKIAAAQERCETFETEIEARIEEAIAKIPVDMTSKFTENHPEELVF